ncbi:MAG: DUF4340 domain-containing protein [Sedimentisphaerales bacterium]|nr:DUF4340 domain-containing protein [Sedimentisphaerales bacterium]
MSNKSLAILGIVAAAMVILAVVLSGLSGGPRKGSTGPAYLIQGLDPAGIGRIVIGSGDKVVTLRRRGNAFMVAEKSNYLADIKQVNELIQKCADIKTTGSAHTSNPANHADLEVTEDKGKSVVKFFTPDPNSTFITGVVVGKNIEAGQGSYVRRLPDDEVYITTESPWIKDQATDYIDQELFSVKREDINSVTVNPGGDSYTLKAGSGDAVSLENLPAGKKLKNTDARSVLTALTGLRFDDVSRSIGGLAFNEQYTCRLNDLTVYALSIAQKDDKTYVVAEAKFTGERPNEVKENDSQEELKKKEALLLASDNAAAFTARHKGWIYQVPDWNAKNLTKKLADLLEDIEKPKDPNAPAPKPTEPKPAETAPTKTAEPAPAEIEIPADPNSTPLVPSKVVEPKPEEPMPAQPDGSKPDDPDASNR